MERNDSHRHFCGPGLPDAVSVSRHGPDIGEVSGKDLAAHLSRESLKPGGIAEMWVMENAAGHYLLGGGVEKEETLFGALVGVHGGSSSDILDDVLDLVHDVAG